MLVLVGYATYHGSTRQIAERIALRLAERGLQVETLDMPQIHGVLQYDALVLGSAVHNMAWLPEGMRVLKEHRAALSERPVWLFSVGMPAALPSRVRQWGADQENRRLLGALQQVVLPRGHRLFSGVFRPEHTSTIGKVIFRLMLGRYGDYRDWAEIDAWADAIARELPVAAR